MSPVQAGKHRCYRCSPYEGSGPVKGPDGRELELESVETTFADDGSKVFLASGYSAREVAQDQAKESGGQVYVNNLSRRIKQPDLTVSVAYAVAKSPVYTLKAPDAFHEKIYRAYWPPLS